jgi:hypothetical protein
LTLPRAAPAARIIFASLTFAALQYPLTTSVTWLFASQGRGRDSFLAISIISIIVIASFIAGLPFGPAGVAISYSASCLLIQLPIPYHLAGRSGPVSAGDLWIGFLRHLALWGVVLLVAWLVCLLIPDDQPLKELLIAAPTSLLAGVVFIFVYPTAPPGGREPVLHLAWVEESSMKPLVSILSGANGSFQTAEHPESKA